MRRRRRPFIYFKKKQIKLNQLKSHITSPLTYFNAWIMSFIAPLCVSTISFKWLTSSSLIAEDDGVQCTQSATHDDVSQTSSFRTKYWTLSVLDFKSAWSSLEKSSALSRKHLFSGTSTAPVKVILSANDQLKVRSASPTLWINSCHGQLITCWSFTIPDLDWYSVIILCISTLTADGPSFAPRRIKIDS